MERNESRLTEIEPQEAASGTDSSAGSVRAAALFGVALVGVHLYRFRGWSHVVDDAWISFRVARNWLDPGVLTYNPSHPAVEGATNLLWTLLSASWIAAWPDLDPAVVARVVGGLFYLAAVVVLVHTASREVASLGGNPSITAWATAALIGVSVSPAYFAISGLETGLWAFLFAVVVDLYARCLRGTEAAALPCGVALGLLALTRPEGVAVGGLLCLALAVSDLRRAARLAAPFLLTVVTVEAFRWWTYGALVPNTFYAKPPDPSEGARYVGWYFLYGLGLLGPIAMFPALRLHASLPRILALLALALTLGTLWSGGDWMPGFRRLTLVTCVAALLMGMGLGVARGGWRAAAAVGVAAAAMGNLGAAKQIEWSSYNNRVMEQLGRLAEQTPEIQSVALVDIGQFGWYFKGSIFDVVGLTDAHIAHLPGGHGRKRWDESYFRQRRPDLVILAASNFKPSPIDLDFRLRPPERWLFTSMLAGGGYRFHAAVPYSAGREALLLFAREGLELPEETWDVASSRDLFGEAIASLDRLSY
ncbi:MAG: hypothetical protein O7B29_15510 [Deltaproteobacteria bacterium]|nr:hypothetical protein [Deltaproteobacteria bacterium]